MRVALTRPRRWRTTVLTATSAVAIALSLPRRSASGTERRLHHFPGPAYRGWFAQAFSLHRRLTWSAIWDLRLRTSSTPQMV